MPPLPPEDRERLQELFERAIDLTPAEREVLLKVECAGKGALRAELEWLLAGDAGEDRLSRAQPLATERAGTTIGPYRLLERVGEGGMGVVYVAEQRVPIRRRVALKLIKPGMDSAQVVARFEAERQALARMTHANIAQVFDAGTTEEGLPFFVMEFVAGDPITEHCDRYRLSTRERIELFLALCDGVQHAHQKGIVHRDLKPSNLLVMRQDARAIPKIIDFGVARATTGQLAERTLLTMVGQLVGTLDYMSPEQADPTAVDIDTRSDIYSLGVVLYQLASGLLPFDHTSTDAVQLSEVQRVIRDVDPPTPSTRLRRETRTATPIAPLHGTDQRTLVRQLSGDLDWICLKALEKDPARRYASASELADDLRRHLAHEPVLARRPGVLYRARKFIRRNRVGVTAGVLVASAGLAGLLGVVAGRLEAQARAREVMRLSALQTLDDLVAEADALWPALPEHIARYDDWLARAAELASELSEHEATLAELRTRARPWTGQEQAQSRANHVLAPRLAAVTEELVYLRRRQEIRRSGVIPREPTPAEVGLDPSALAADAAALDRRAWPLVDPARRAWGGEARGLLLARHALALAEEQQLAPAQRAKLQSTLAWALFAAERFEEAMEQMERGLAQASAGERPMFEKRLEKLAQALDAELAPGADEELARDIARLEAQATSLREQTAQRTQWTFDEAQDRWWHGQLAKLVEGLLAFASPENGLFSGGISPEHGWGIRKRREFAASIVGRTTTAPRVAAAWEAAAVRVAASPLYAGLALSPQVGLEPLGPDPVSGLEEFAHVQTGSVPARDVSGRLSVSEDQGIVLVLVPGGTLWMGAQNSDPAAPNYDPHTPSYLEGPVHRVTLSPYFLSKYEMTQGQWQRVAGRNPSRIKPGPHSRFEGAPGLPVDLTHPVEAVNWIRCDELCRRLDLSLPSEAQWEYGARAGTSGVWWTGDTEETLVGAANLSAGWMEDGSAGHARVGSYAPNGFGLFDVVGNVWEWSLDGYAPDFYAGSPRLDPVCELAESENHVCRGGGYGDIPARARSAGRRAISPEYAGGAIGLRAARALR